MWVSCYVLFEILKLIVFVILPFVATSIASTATSFVYISSSEKTAVPGRE